MFSIPLLILLANPFLFYPAFLVIAIFFAFLTEHYEQYEISGALIIFAALGLQFFTDVQPFTYIATNWMQSLWIFGGWFVVGTIYALVKWWIYVTKAARDIKDYILHHPSISVSEAASRLGYGYRKRLGYGYGKEIPFLASEHKSKIVGWIIFWIFSLLGTFINDIVVEIANWLYSKIGNVLQMISNNAFKDIKTK